MNFFKRIGRKTAKISTKINRVAVPVISAGAGYFFGAPGAAAVTAAGAQASYYFRATQARNEGKQGQAARSLGRGERKRVAIYGAVGGGAGMLGSGATNLIAGKSLASAAGATLFGQAGANILGIDSIFAKPVGGLDSIVTAGNFAAQKASPVPGLVTQSQLTSTLAGGSTPAEASVAAAGKAGESTLSKVLGLANTVGSRIPGTPQGKSPSGPGASAYKDGLLDGLLSGGGGAGGGGDAGSAGGFMNAPMGEQSQISPAVLIALGVGAFLLMR